MELPLTLLAGGELEGQFLIQILGVSFAYASAATDAAAVVGSETSTSTSVSGVSANGGSTTATSNTATNTAGGGKVLFSNVEFGVTSKSRIVLLGTSLTQ